MQSGGKRPRFLRNEGKYIKKRKKDILYSPAFSTFSTSRAVENLRIFRSITKKALQIKGELSTVIHITHKSDCGKPMMHKHRFLCKNSRKE
jgi:hypothetical protein